MPTIKSPSLARVVLILAQIMSVASVALIWLSVGIPLYMWSAGAAYDVSYLRAASVLFCVGMCAEWVCDEIAERVKDEIVWVERIVASFFEEDKV